MVNARYVDDTPDLDPRVHLSKLLQALSPACQPGSDWPDAKPGDFLLSFEDGTEQLFARGPGVKFQPIASTEKAVEWLPERGSRSAPVEHHDFVPLDAQWIDIGGRKQCLRPNGNRIERTVFVHMMVEGFKTSIALSSTAYDIGRTFSSAADKVRVTIDNEILRVCGALWLMTSELERNNRAQTWFAPRFSKLGVLGEANGPTIEQVKAARDLRFEVKAEENARKAERAALSKVTPTPMLGRAAGSTSFSTGNVERPRSWADSKGPEIVDPKPVEKAAHPIDDDIPF
jgi:hypothetical protein